VKTTLFLLSSLMEHFRVKKKCPLWNKLHLGARKSLFSFKKCHERLWNWYVHMYICTYICWPTFRK
jgi:hypothetical protein